MKPRWSAVWLVVVAFVLAMVPMTANAAPLPAPSLTTPTAGSTVDQPVFSWEPVADAAYYEIEVALDDQFVTVTDPGDEMAPSAIHGTTYIPTYTYTAKTHYWRVRAISADGTEGEWSAARTFTRRWTNNDEAAGVEVGSPASRVNNVRLLSGGPTPPLNEVALTWDPVPGAAYYDVQVGAVGSNESVTCRTPHNILVPPFDGSYTIRGPMDPCTSVISPVRAWIDSPTWSVPSAGRIAIESEDVDTGDLVYVRFLNAAGTATVVPPFSAPVESVGGDPRAMTVTGPSPALAESKVQYFKAALPIEAQQTYYARVRAVDLPNGNDYPGGAVYGMWSDERREPGEALPSLVFTPDDPTPGSGSVFEPVAPDDFDIAGTDAPLLRWEPVPGAVAYRVVIALDRDFTNRVASYKTRNAVMVPPETFDDNGPAGKYYWFAAPCVYSDIAQTEVKCFFADPDAINNPSYVGRFTKNSAPVTDLSQAPIDEQANVVLRWGDALTAAQGVSPSFTPGGVAGYQIQVTTGNWSKSKTLITDNLAYSSSVDQLASGTYRWRVRPLDGQDVPLAWAYGPDFTIVRAQTPSPGPSPTQTPPGTSPTPGTTPAPGPTPTGPAPTYETPVPDAGTAAGIPPESPGTPKVKRASKRKLRVHWRASEELGQPVSAYLVYRSTNGRKFKKVGTTTSQTARFKAKRGRTYWFYVVADSDAGASRPSGTRKFTMR